MGKTVNVILKDKNGEAVTYTGIDTVKLPTDTGEAAAFTLGGGTGEQAEKPEISIDTGEADENGWYPDACIATKNLLGGVNGLPMLSSEESMAITEAAAAAWQEKQAEYEQDGVYMPKARIVVQMSDKSAKDMAGEFTNMGFKNKALRKWLQKAVTQVQEIDFSTGYGLEKPGNIVPACAMAQGFAAPGGALNLGWALGSKLGKQLGQLAEKFLGYIGELLYVYGAELDVTVQAGGWGKSPAASDAAKWYFNFVIADGAGGFLSQNLVVGGKGLAMPIMLDAETESDSYGSEDELLIPSYIAATDKTLLCYECGKNGGATSEEAGALFAYQLGVCDSKQWVKSPLTIEVDEATGWLAVDGHGVMYVCGAGEDGNSPVSSEKYAVPTLSSDGASVSCGNEDSDVFMLLEYAEEEVELPLKKSPSTLADIANTMSGYFKDKEQFALDIRTVGMKAMPSEVLSIVIDKEGNKV